MQHSTEEQRFWEVVGSLTELGGPGVWFDLDAHESSLYITGSLGEDFLLLPAGPAKEHRIQRQSGLLRDIAERRLGGLRVSLDGRVTPR